MPRFAHRKDAAMPLLPSDLKHFDPDDYASAGDALLAMMKFALTVAAVVALVGCFAIVVLA